MFNWIKTKAGTAVGACGLGVVAIVGASTIAEVSVAPASAATSAASATGTSSNEVRTFSYQMKRGAITVSRERNPSMFEGFVSVPAGPGPFPVAVLLHGNHDTCPTANAAAQSISPDALHWRSSYFCSDSSTSKRLTGPDYVRRDGGLTYLAEALARRGIAAIVPDMVSVETMWSREGHASIKAYRAMINRHLEMLRGLNEGKRYGTSMPKLTGLFDFNKLAFVGHSRGASASIELSKFFKKTFATVSVEPLEDSGRTRPTRGAYLNIRGGCDEEVGPAAGTKQVTNYAAAGGAQALDALIPGLGHSVLNTSLNYSQELDCEGFGKGGAADVRPQVAEMVAAFVSQSARNATSYTFPVFGTLKPEIRNYATTGAPIVLEPTSVVPTYTPTRELPRYRGDHQFLKPLKASDKPTNKEWWAAG